MSRQHDNIGPGPSSQKSTHVDNLAYARTDLCMCGHTHSAHMSTGRSCLINGCDCERFDDSGGHRHPNGNCYDPDCAEPRTTTTQAECNSAVAEVIDAAALLNEFAWSAVTTDCTESRAYLQGLIDPPA